MNIRCSDRACATFLFFLFFFFFSPPLSSPPHPPPPTRCIVERAIRIRDPAVGPHTAMLEGGRSAPGHVTALDTTFK